MLHNENVSKYFDKLFQFRTFLTEKLAFAHPQQSFLCVASIISKYLAARLFRTAKYIISYEYKDPFAPFPSNTLNTRGAIHSQKLRTPFARRSSTQRARKNIHFNSQEKLRLDMKGDKRYVEGSFCDPKRENFESVKSA